MLDIINILQKRLTEYKVEQQRKGNWVPTMPLVYACFESDCMTFYELLKNNLGAIAEKDRPVVIIDTRGLYGFKKYFIDRLIKIYRSFALLVVIYNRKENLEAAQAALKKYVKDIKDVKLNNFITIDTADCKCDAVIFYN